MQLTGLMRCLFVTGLLMSGNVFAKNNLFDEYSLTLPFEISRAPVAVNITTDKGTELFVIGTNDKQQRVGAIVKYDDELKQLKVIDSFLLATSFLAFDIGEKDTNGLQALYFLSKSDIVQYLPNHQIENQKLVKIHDVKSMYIADKSPYILALDFAKDLNNDKQDDFILADFQQVNLWLSHCCGNHHQQTLPITPQVKVNSDGINVEKTSLYFVDATTDNKMDIVEAKQGALIVYSQLPDGTFSPVATEVQLNSTIHSLNWWDMMEADGQSLDQSDLSHKTIESVTDVNADGVIDVVVRFTKSSGVLDRTNDYEFYFGKMVDNTLVIPEKYSTNITADETLSDLMLVDINNDDIHEVMVRSFDIGISEVIGALLSGSVELEVLIFQMDKNFNFKNKPVVKEDVALSFSLSKGRTGSPLINVSDINGDGANDLVVTSDDNEFIVKWATPKGKTPLSRKKHKHETTVPQAAENILIADINGDDKGDAVLHYGRLDDAKMLTKLKILVAK